MPEMSVLLPARNAQDTVAHAVASTLRALPRDAEIVVLDDGSCDATAERAERAGGGDARLRVLRRPPSGGISRALATLLAETDSRFVARMDADDVTLPARFRHSLPLLGEHDVAFTQVMTLRGRALRPQAPVPLSADAMPLHLLLTNPLCHPTMIAHREVVERVGGYRDVPAEDYDLWIRAALDGARLVRSGRWGLLYRLHDAQITASAAWRSRSWDDDEQARVFADLARVLTGRPLRRLVAIAQEPWHRRDVLLAEFESAVAPAVARVPGLQGRLLERRLHRRLADARRAPAPLIGETRP